MIIKSTSRKSPSFSQLYDYINDEIKFDNDKYYFTQNTFGSSREEILNEFIQNSNLLQKRKGGNYIYHDILSIKKDHKLDLDKQKDILQDLAEQYAQTRAKRNFVYGAMHTDKEDNLHYHLMISANEVGSSKRYRLTKKDFNSLKVGLEEYLLQTYPELKQDRVITKKNHKEEIKTEKEFQSTKRTGRKSQKDKARDLVKDLLSEPLSQEAFIFKCRDLGVTPYLRGKSYGVIIGEKRYRLKTLGLESEFQKYERDFLLSKEEKDDKKAEFDYEDMTKKQKKEKPTEAEEDKVFNKNFSSDYDEMREKGKHQEHEASKTRTNKKSR